MYFANKNNGEIPLQSLSAYFDEVKLRKRGVSNQTGALLQQYILQIVKCLSIAGVFKLYSPSAKALTITTFIKIIH